MTAKSRPDKKKLSKSILEMKFMKKSKEKAYLEEEDEEGRAVFASELTEAMKKGGSKYIIEPSFVPCEDLIVGRLSYHGMNPEIEKLIAAEKAAVNVKKEKPDVEVTDVEMAKRYSALVGTMEKRFKNKNERRKGTGAPQRKDTDPPPRKKTKFLKPKDE